MKKFTDPISANVISSYMRSKDVGVFVTHTVGELLWGYEDGLLQALKLFKPELDDVFGLFHKVSLKQMGTYYRLECVYSWNVAAVIGFLRRHYSYRATKVGDEWFCGVKIFVLQSNASNDGEYVFFTGQQNYKDFARVDTWNGEK